MPGHRVCPWWIDLLGIPFRRLIQDPAAIVAPYVHKDMTVLEPGPGMGFTKPFTFASGRRADDDLIMARNSFFRSDAATQS